MRTSDPEASKKISACAILMVSSECAIDIAIRAGYCATICARPPPEDQSQVTPAQTKPHRVAGYLYPGTQKSGYTSSKPNPHRVVC